MKKPILCEHGKELRNGMEVGLICEISNLNCAYVRWCGSTQCIAMTNNYKNCKGRTNMAKAKKDEEVKVVDEVVTKKPTAKKKPEVKKVEVVKKEDEKVDEIKPEVVDDNPVILPDVIVEVDDEIKVDDPVIDTKVENTENIELKLDTDGDAETDDPVIDTEDDDTLNSNVDTDETSETDTEENTDETPETEEPTLTKICKILWYRNNKVAFDFDGFGISFKTDKDLTKQVKVGFVNVEFEGTIGKPDFKVLNVK